VIMGSALAYPTGDAMLALIYNAGNTLRTRLALVEYVQCMIAAQAEGRTPTEGNLALRARVQTLGEDIDILWDSYEPDLDISNYVFEKRQNFQRGLHALIREMASIIEVGKFLDTKYMQQAGMKSPAQARAAAQGAAFDD